MRILSKSIASASSFIAIVTALSLLMNCIPLQKACAESSDSGAAEAYALNTSSDSSDESECDFENDEGFVDQAEGLGEDDELIENSWRYSDGQLLTVDQGASTEIASLSEAVSAASIVDGGGYQVFDWFDQFSQGYYTGTDALKGIDVSVHQGTIDWAKVKEAGIDFAIIRCGYGNDLSSQDDRQWLNNVKGCVDNGIPFGVYIYSYATDTAMATSEAQHVLRCLNNAGLSASDLVYAVYLDMEDSTTINSNHAAIATTFCTAIQAAGYTPGIYANLNWFTNYLTDACFDEWTKWVAEYNASIGLTYDGLSNFSDGNGIWQFSSSGNVPGIEGNVDLDYTYMGCGDLYKPSVDVEAGTQTIADGIYALQSASGSEQVVDVMGSSQNKTANIAMYRNLNNANQKFKVEYQNNGFYTLTAVHSGMLLDVEGGCLSAGANVSQYPKVEGSDNQQWVIRDEGDGWYRLISKRNGLCLDVEGGVAGNSVNVQCYPETQNNDGKGQLFKFVQLPIDNGYYCVESADSQDYVLDVVAASIEDGANVTVYRKTGGDNQCFQIYYCGDGYYKIVAVHSWRALDVVAGGKANGTNVTQWSQYDTDNQAWLPEKQSDGSFKFQSKTNSLYLDVQGGHAGDTVNVWTYESTDNNDGKGQRFFLEAV